MIVVYGFWTSAPDSTLWLSTREGALHSSDQGKNWEHALGGLPPREILNVRTHDAAAQRLLATGLHTRTVFESKDGGVNWQKTPQSIVSIRAAMNYQGRILAATSHNGLLLEKRNEVAEQARPNQITSGASSAASQ